MVEIRNLAGSVIHKVEGESLIGVDLRGADLIDADLTGSDLTDANMSGVDLTGAKLYGASLRRSDLRGADLRGVDLSGVDLSGVDLTGAKLTGSDLRGSDLSDANLSGVDLSGVCMRGANLSGVDLSGVDLTGAKGLPDAPVVADIDRAILNAAVQSPGCFDMAYYEGDGPCGTTHCRAGWAVALAGEPGKKLQSALGWSAAGALIYHASRPGRRVPNFYAFTDDALDDLRACAEATA